MKIYLIRHGETNENKETKLMGRSHGVLSDKGKHQARLTGDALRDKNFRIIYSSPLDRCFDTAQIINEFLQKDIIKDDLLIERDFGELTNSLAKDIDFDTLDVSSEENTRLGVETLEAVKIRLQTFLDNLRKVDSQSNVLIVSHNNPMRVMLGIVLDKTYNEILNEYKIRNCGITVFDVSGNGDIKVEKIDDIRHLD